MRNGSTMPRSASDCSTSALTPSDAKLLGHVLVRLLDFGFETQETRIHKEEREPESHGTARCRPWHQGSCSGRTTRALGVLDEDVDCSRGDQQHGYKGEHGFGCHERFAGRVSGMASVGLKAVAFVSER